MDYEIIKNNIGLKIYAGTIEEEAKKQIDLICEHPAMKELIAIMPDVHAGSGCVIGFTGKFKDAVIPSVVGVDIGCGVLCYGFEKKKIDFERLDKYIRKEIPLGFGSRKLNWINAQKIFEELPVKLEQEIRRTSFEAEEFLIRNNIVGNNLPLEQMGTLGGGNHFIEVDKGDDEKLYITIHTGSRNFGLRVATHYQDMAKNLMKEMGIKVPKDLEYLPLSCGGNEYISLLRLAQKYARLNRALILYIILDYLGEQFHDDSVIESVHNYISERDHVIRKGAISAHKDEKVVIPLNMGEGIVIGTGKGNKDYNWSAPHGAGRLFGRKEMMRKLKAGNQYTMKGFKEIMEGVFTTSISENTFDEAPFAYKSWDSISPFVGNTIEIDQIAKPVYNLKAPGE